METDRYSVSGNHPENQYYLNTEILINNLSIQRQELLDEFENQALTQTVQMFFNKIDLIETFNSSLLQDIHRYFLGKLYPWAGKFRTVAIKKANTTFAMPQYIPQLMEKFDKQLSQENYSTEFDLKKLTYFKCELIAIHPFREGNGRTIRLFTDLLSIKSGSGRINYPEEDTNFKSAYIKASEAAVVNADYHPMFDLLKTLQSS